MKVMHVGNEKWDEIHFVTMQMEWEVERLLKKVFELYIHDLYVLYCIICDGQIRTVPYFPYHYAYSLLPYRTYVRDHVWGLKAAFYTSLDVHSTNEVANCDVIGDVGVCPYLLIDDDALVLYCSIAG